MKILIVDDDESVRLFLQRLLIKKFQCEVLEARDGLEGLSLIQSEMPDLVLLDVRMPVMDGLEVLEALRSDCAFASMPVIVMSVVSDKAEVTGLISIGISDYILKPLWSETVYKRVQETLIKSKSRRHNAAASKVTKTPEGKKRLLLVDKDLNFRTFFSSVLSRPYQIDEIDSGTGAIEMYVGGLHPIVCIGEGLTLLNERLLARKIREFDKEGRTSLYLCSEGMRTIVGDPQLFDGVIKKSFVPEVFEKEFARIVNNEKSPHEVLMDIVHNFLPAELGTATQQTIGVVSTQEIHMLSSAEVGNIADDVYATSELFGMAEGLRLNVALVGSSGDVVNVAEKILGSPASLENGAKDAFGELVNTISGRVRSSIEARGIKVEQGPPLVTLKNGNTKPMSWDLCIPFQTDGGQKYFVGVAVKKL